MSIRSLLTVAAAASMFAALAQTTTTTTATTRSYTFPPVSVGTSQTAELDVVNVAANSTNTNASCSVTLSILGATDNTLQTSGSSPTTLTTGQIASLKVAGTGAPVRAVVTITPATTSPRPPCSLEFSFQVYDTGAGAIHVFLNGADQVAALPIGR